MNISLVHLRSADLRSSPKKLGVNMFSALLFLGFSFFVWYCVQLTRFVAILFNWGRKKLSPISMCKNNMKSNKNMKCLFFLSGMQDMDVFQLSSDKGGVYVS